MIVISACLCADACRYDAKDSLHPIAYSFLKEGKALPVCPEILGGFQTPRSPAEIRGGDGWDVLCKRARVYDQQGIDVTAGFIKGAQATLELCILHGVKLAILKAKSPSCGYGAIYDGSFTGTLLKGDGVTAALLKRHEIEIRVF